MPGVRNLRRLTDATLCAVFVLASCLAMAQEALDEEARRRELRERERLLEEARREPEAEEEEKAARAKISDMLDLDYGGWVEYGYLDFRDALKRRQAGELDTRVYGDLRIQDIHRIYARFRTNYVRFRSDHGYGDDKVWMRPKLDQGFYEMNVSRFFDQSLGYPIPGRWDLSAGRKFFYIGRGLAYAQRADGMEARGRYGDFKLKSFFTRSISSDSDIDQARPDPGSSRRNFWGLEVRYTGLGSQEPYAFVLLQRDRNASHIDSTFQRYKYDSEYWGVGMEGRLFRNVRHYVEYILETGESTSRGRLSPRDDIMAQALQAGVEYLIPVETKPKVHFSYMYGSGDHDRIRPTTSRRGNRAGTNDRGFIGFGYADTGLALAPRLTNLHVFKLGGSIQPFTRHRQLILRKMEVGSNFYGFVKDRSGAGISDPAGGRDNGFVGSEIDAFLLWHIFSDWSVRLQVGYFMPGEAFSTIGKSRDRTYIGLYTTYRF